MYIMKYLNDWNAISNLFRHNGIITEGFNPNRDVYERKYTLMGFTLVRDVHTFAKSGKVRLLAKPREGIEVSRPGVVMSFDNWADLAKRMYKLAEHEGHSVAPECSWIVTNKATGVHRTLAPNRPAYAKAMKDGVSRIPSQWDPAFLMAA